MKRLHLSIAVADLERSGEFYDRLLGRAPDVTRPDYRQWRLDDPPLNLSLNADRSATGVDHVGLQFEDAAALEGLQQRLHAAGLSGIEERDTHCCYARSDKEWLTDPDGIAWELFSTHARDDDAAPADTCCHDESVACCA